MDDKCIAVIGNNSYIHHILSYVKSLQQTNPEIPIEILLINVSDNNLSKIIELNNNCIITQKYTKNNIRPYIQRDLENMRGFCMNSRINFLIELQLKYNKILLFDANTIFNTDISKHFEILEDCDLYALKKPKKKEFFAGIFGIRNTPIMIQFMKVWLSDVISKGYNKMDSDQLSFYRTYLKLKPNIRFQSFDHIYVKFSFPDNLDIWIAKGPKKDINIKYNKRKYEVLYIDDNSVDIILILTTNPVLNKLKQCLDSLINQTFTNWKLYIVDYNNINKVSSRIYKRIPNDPRIHYYKNYKTYESDDYNITMLSAHNKGYSNYITWITDNMVLPVHYVNTLYNSIISDNYDIIETSRRYIYKRSLLYNIDDYTKLFNTNTYIDIDIHKLKIDL
jgi:hypothetical protein